MAGRIPQQFIDELVTRIDIVDVIDAQVPLRKTGKDYVACCPFHDEKTPSFTVSHDKQFYHCFGCGAHGTAIGFLMEFDQMDFLDAVRELASRVGMELPQTKAYASQTQATKSLYDILEQASSFYQRQLKEHSHGKNAIDYLKKRGLDGRVAAKYGIGYAPPGWDNLKQQFGRDETSQKQLVATGMSVKKESGGYYDRFRDRIMFPIRDQRGRVIGFGGRVMGKDTPKYMNSPETAVFHKGRELYGLHEARQSLRNIDRLLVVEGYMDVVMLAKHGFQYAVATLGTATTPEHLERMYRVTAEVVFCFDGDQAGSKAAWRALENTLPIMREGRQARFMFLPQGEDPDTLVQKEGQALFGQRIVDSVSLSTFFYENLTQQVDISSIDGRARLVELARQMLSKLPQGVFRHMMIERLAELAQMNAHTLAGLLTKPARDTLQKRRTDYKRKERPIHSLVRNGITLLLQQPALAKLANQPRSLRGLKTPGIDLFIEMLELLQDKPHLNTSALIEHWRGSDEGGYLAKLAQQESLISAPAMEQEFQDTISRLHRNQHDQRVDYLSNKSLNNLSQDEKTELRQLLTHTSPRS